LPRRITILLLILVSLGLCRRADAVPDCLPTATLEGDLTLGRAVRQLLQLRGISTERMDDCPAVSATLHKSSAGIDVILDDGPDRQHRQAVSDIGTAATIIESWTRSDLSAPLLEKRQPLLSAAESQPGTVTAAVQQSVPPILVGTLIGLDRGNDGSIWIDSQVTGCVRVGPLCPGALFRVGFDLRQTGSSDRLNTDRTTFDLLITTDYRIQLPTLVLSPGMGFGVSYLRGRSPSPAISGATEVEDLGGLLADLHLSTEIPLRRHLTVEFRLGADVSPLTATTAVTENNIILAGKPRWSIRGGIGLRYGAQ